MTLAGILLSSLLLQAQEVNFVASVDKNPVPLGAVFSVKFTLENARGDIKGPEFKDFDVIMGPSTSSSFQFINGKQSSTMVLSYTLRPRSKGTFTIGQAYASAGGKTYRSEPIEIKVVEGAAGAQSQPGTQQGRGGASAPAGSDRNLIVQMQVSKRSAYRGEGILISFVLLSRYNNLDLGETEFPKLDGFWTEDVKSGQVTWEPNYEYIQGVPYRKAVLRQQLLFPQRAGTIEIEPFKVNARVNRSFFNPGTEVSASSYAQSIEVKALPPGAPESFQGAVGDFKISSIMPKTQLAANDAIDLSVKFQGKGHLRMLKSPELNFPGDFEVYDPEIKDRISVSAAGMSGSRSFEYLIIPRYAGKYDIPARDYTFFNPYKGQYVTQALGPYSIEVSGEDGLVPERSGAAIARSRVEDLAQDIRYISTRSDDLQKLGSGFFRSAGFYFLAWIPLLLVLGFTVLHKKREAIFGDVKSIRRRKAHQMAKRRLSEADTAMKAGDSKRFYAEIFNAMYGYLADKLGMEKAALTKNIIKEELAQREIEKHLVQEVIYIIETCEVGRFAPVGDSSDSAFYARVMDFIEKLEAKFK